LIILGEVASKKEEGTDRGRRGVMYKACWKDKGRFASVIALSGMLISTSPVKADEPGGAEVFVPEEKPVAAVAKPECPGCAECAECAVPNTGRISFNLGMDFATQYIFRGIVQENGGFIGQPYAEVGIDVFQGDGALNNVTLTGGIWNSLHSRENSLPSRRNGDIGSDSGPDSWYEADVYGGVAVGLLDTMELSTTYTAYTSPNDEFDTFQEVAFGLGIDDSDLLGDLALSPSVLFAIETQNSAFGPNRGTYVEIRGGPEFSCGGGCPVTLSLPMRAGFSLDDYYSTTEGNPADDFTETDPGFGFFDIGLEAGVPLEMIPSEFGAWEATAGVHFTSLGRTLAHLNNGDDTEVYGLFGIGMTY
jgi:hypothetical protein